MDYIESFNNKKLISNEAWNASKILYRQYMSDPKAPLYVEMDDLVPDFETASSIIREAGGLVFIPHIYEYKHNAMPILDGAEACYPVYSAVAKAIYKDIDMIEHDYLKNMNDENNLRDLIHTIASMAGKDVDKEKEDKIVNAVKNNQVNDEIKKMNNKL